MHELNAFLAAWEDGPSRTRAAFLRLKEFLAALPGVCFAYRGRPGVSRSLRAARQGQAGRPLFAILDVIDDDPSARWLSVCMYADLAADPEGRGTPVPRGILGEDALCFDLEEWDGELLAYVEARLAEAHAAAAA